MVDAADSLRISLEKFIDHVDALDKEDDAMGNGFYREYKNLRDIADQQKEDHVFPVEEGKKPHNTRKNRYKDILPFDETRVVLKKEDEQNNYINANFIKDFRHQLAYIASQGPLPHTVDDFWCMIWMYDAKVIIMACKEEENHRKKCQRYWPQKIGEKEKFGSITVTLESEETMSDDDDCCTVRQLVAEYEDQIQHVVQFQYTGWPDHGIPDDIEIILEMIAEWRKIRDNDPEKSPAVIHCSAGCGRTGTVIAIDYAWEVLKTGNLKEDFNLYEIIKEMREQRQSMVQTPDQYKMAHMAVKQLFQEHLNLMVDHIYSNFEEGSEHGYYNDLDTNDVDVSVESHYEPVMVGTHLKDSFRTTVVTKKRQTLQIEVNAALNQYYAKTPDKSLTVNNKPPLCPRPKLESKAGNNSSPEESIVKKKIAVMEKIKEDEKNVRSCTTQGNIFTSGKNAFISEQSSKPVVQNAEPLVIRKNSISDLMGIFQERKDDKPETTLTSSGKVQAVNQYLNIEFNQDRAQVEKQNGVEEMKQKVDTEAHSGDKSSTSGWSDGDKKIEKKGIHVTTIIVGGESSHISSQDPESKKTVSPQNSSGNNISMIQDGLKSHRSIIQRRDSKRSPQQCRSSYLEPVEILTNKDFTKPVANPQGSLYYTEVKVKSFQPTIVKNPSEEEEGPPLPYRGYEEDTSIHKQKENSDGNWQAWDIGKKFKAFFSSNTPGTVADTQESSSSEYSKSKGFGIRVAKPMGPRPTPTNWNRISE